MLILLKFMLSQVVEMKIGDILEEEKPDRLQADVVFSLIWQCTEIHSSEMTV